ncbi:hypothetical protein SAMN04487972_103103 [Paracoccus halophilus]|uniref:Uncharacterized protein n=1 Tax=Paracoccus halophilus TaxID=376733 RepID=A0A099F4U2_9RHOB|nr:hypothetical protein [Paracoccus halophilus]KGJ05162.1 hypothetical protein IT41_07185 [Paracoccus halophilus]SFA43812.1 hypothetical protein SAMN04487972_103103 [Paracoccus halophilus]
MPRYGGCGSGPVERRLIWEYLLPSGGERAADTYLTFLADPFEIVGGEICNAVSTGYPLAAQEGERLAMRHCVRSLSRELGKIGRLADCAKFGHWQEVLLPSTPGRVPERPSSARVLRPSDDPLRSRQRAGC